MIVLFLTLSRTLTTPLTTLVSVPAQESWTSHSVPRTVAALYWPRVRKEPEPEPHSLRVLGFLAAARAPPLFGHFASAWLSVRSVVFLPSVSLKMPSKNVAVCGLPPGLSSAVRMILPFVTSISEPVGIAWLGSNGTNLPPFLIRTVPLGLPTASFWGTGVGVGVGVAVGGGVGVGVGG